MFKLRKNLSIDPKFIQSLAVAPAARETGFCVYITMSGNSRAIASDVFEKDTEAHELKETLEQLKKDAM